MARIGSENSVRVVCAVLALILATGLGLNARKKMDGALLPDDGAIKRAEEDEIGGLRARG